MKENFSVNLEEFRKKLYCPIRIGLKIGIYE